MAIKCTKCPKNIYRYIPTFSIPRPSKIYPNWEFWFRNISSGNPVSELVQKWFGHTNKIFTGFSSLNIN
jgi:hypothetical protein